MLAPDSFCWRAFLQLPGAAGAAHAAPRRSLPTGPSSPAAVCVCKIHVVSCPQNGTRKWCLFEERTLGHKQLVLSGHVSKLCSFSGAENGSLHARSRRAITWHSGCTTSGTGARASPRTWPQHAQCSQEHEQEDGMLRADRWVLQNGALEGETGFHDATPVALPHSHDSIQRWQPSREREAATPFPRKFASHNPGSHARLHAC